MPKPRGSSNARQEMYFVNGERLAMEWIRHAVRRRDDDIGSNQGSGTLKSLPRAGDVNLTHCAPGRGEFLDHFPLTAVLR